MQSVISLVQMVCKQVKAYLDSTSCEKNNCRGQSIEYSSVIPSQPSTSPVTFDEAAPELPLVLAFDLDTSNCADFTETPIEGILEEANQIKMGKKKQKEPTKRMEF